MIAVQLGAYVAAGTPTRLIEPGAMAFAVVAFRSRSSSIAYVVVYVVAVKMEPLSRARLRPLEDGLIRDVHSVTLPGLCGCVGL